MTEDEIRKRWKEAGYDYDKAREEFAKAMKDNKPKPCETCGTEIDKEGNHKESIVDMKCETNEEEE